MPISTTGAARDPGGRTGRADDTVSALVYAVIADRCVAPPADRAFPHNDVVRFVVGQRSRLSGPLRPAMAALTWAFAASTLLRTCRPFRTLPADRRRRRLDAWRASRLGPCREFVRFHESLALFAWYSHPAVLAAAGEEVAARPAA